MNTVQPELVHWEEVIATLSHELRTPLTAIIGYARLLKSGKLDPSAAEQAIQALYRNAELQSHLVSDLLACHGCVQVRLFSMDSHAEIKVIDNGLGLSPEFLPHVFEKFRQADNSAARQNGGLGLGLAIVRDLVKMHGGIVEAESKGVGCGSAFTVKLPLRTMALKKAS